MELRHLRYFTAVAEHLNYSEASRRIHVAQPAISQTIIDLEEELGVRLLLRDRRKVVDTLGLRIACRLEPADISDRKAAALLLGGLRPLFPNIRTVIADAGHQGRKLARHLLRQDGWKTRLWTRGVPPAGRAKFKSLVSSRSALSQSLEGSAGPPDRS
jgi:DNA-binding transcriptional ArsR family regulator